MCVRGILSCAGSVPASLQASRHQAALRTVRQSDSKQRWARSPDLCVWREMERRVSTRVTMREQEMEAIWQSGSYFREEIDFLFWDSRKWALHVLCNANRSALIMLVKLLWHSEHLFRIFFFPSLYIILSCCNYNNRYGSIFIAISDIGF